MNLFLVFSFVSFVACLVLGIGVYFQAPKQSLNKIFAALCLVTSYIAITDYMYSGAGSVEATFLWLKVRFLCAIIIPLQLHFVLIFTKNRIINNPAYLMLFYLPALIISLLQIYSPGILYKTPDMEMGMYIMELNHSWVSWVLLVWVNVMLFASIYYCVRYFVKENNVIEKRKARIVLAGILLIFATSIISESGIFNVEVSRFMYLSAIMFPMIFGYAIWKYRIFSLTSDPIVNRIMSTISDYVVLMDNDFRILAVNQVFIDTIGRGVDEITGKNIHIFIEPPAEAQDNKEYLTSEYIKNYEINLKTKNGRSVPILIGTSFIKNRKGKTTKILLTGKDITNVKDLREKLRQKEKILKLQAQVAFSEKMASVGRLAGGIAHEINNPLTVTLGYSQLLLKNKDKKDPEYEKLNEISNQALRCKTLIEKLNVFSHFSGGRIKEENVNELIEKAIDNIKDIIIGKNITIIRKYTEKIPNIMVDGVQMVYAISNLLQNAYESMEGNEGKIEIHTEKEDNFVKINIIDNGIGIKKESIGVIFEPFFTTKPHKQAGLGLSMCYEIIKKHNGEMICKSEPGKGSIFEIMLPLGQI